MPSRISEAIVLRTYPFQEGDLVVSFFTRDQGKLRGVAKRAKGPKSAFGSGLQRLSQVRMSYFQRENRELVSLDSCELVYSQFGVLGDYDAAVALDFLAEISDQLLPLEQPSERFFRLMSAVLEHLRGGSAGCVWRTAVYFALWAVRLSGFLPELHACGECGVFLNDEEAPERAFYRKGARTALVCGTCRGALGAGGFWELTSESRTIAGNMLRHPVSEIGPALWTRDTASDLRRFLVQQIETHIERRLITAPLLDGEN